jgi:hypothetical protein
MRTDEHTHPAHRPAMANFSRRSGRTWCSCSLKAASPRRRDSSMRWSDCLARQIQSCTTCWNETWSRRWPLSAGVPQSTRDELSRTLGVARAWRG